MQLITLLVVISQLFLLIGISNNLRKAGSELSNSSLRHSGTLLRMLIILHIVILLTILLIYNDSLSESMFGIFPAPDPVLNQDPQIFP